MRSRYRSVDTFSDASLPWKAYSKRSVQSTHHEESAYTKQPRTGDLVSQPIKLGEGCPSVTIEGISILRNHHYLLYFYWIIKWLPSFFRMIFKFPKRLLCSPMSILQNPLVDLITTGMVVCILINELILSSKVFIGHPLWEKHYTDKSCHNI